MLSFVIFGQSDTTAPQPQSLSFSSILIDTSTNPKNVSATLQITDDLSGFAFGVVSLRSPSGKQVADGFFDSNNRISGDAKNGIYQTVINFPQNSEAGTWQVTYLVLRDIAGNSKFYLTNDFLALGFPTDLQVTSCTFSISPTSQQIVSVGGRTTVNVTSPLGCNWTTISNADWIDVISGNGGDGNGEVTILVEVNTRTARTGTVIIAGQTFTVNQAAACSFDISPRRQDIDAAGGNVTVAITTQPGCNWSVISNDSFITITSEASGSGNGIVSFNIAQNVSVAARTATVFIAGQRFIVTQASLKQSKSRKKAKFI